MYFAGYDIASSGEETNASLSDRPLDVGGDTLPFGHLGDRRFEILAYRLKLAELAASGHRVALMQGTGDQGRDVIVHSPSGKLLQIVQCKNYRAKFSAPDLRRELLKLALHNHRDPTILDGGPVGYELWCPAGLTQQAVTFLQTWPRSWNVDALAAEAGEVIESYVAFDGLSWAAVGQKVVEDFARSVTPTHVTDVIATERVKRVFSVYETFFQGKVMLAREDALDALEKRDEELLKVFTQVVESGFAKLTDAHSKHVIERISSFSPDQRLAHLSGYVMGLPADLVARFNKDELEAFMKHSIAATQGVIHTVITATARLAREHADDFRQRIQPRERDLSMVLPQVLTFSMNARVTGMLMQTRKLVPELEAFAHFNLHERFEYCAGLNWDSYQRCLAGYVPGKHAQGSDEELRYLLAVHGIQSTKSRADYQQRILAAVARHLTEIEATYDKFMRLVPEEILVITDTVSAFENKALGDLMVKSINSLERLRREHKTD